MPTRASLMIAIALGCATMFGAMGALTMMAGAMAQSAVNGKTWSEEMTAITTRGATIMLTGGGVMLVLALACGLLGLMLSRNNNRPAPRY